MQKFYMLRVEISYAASAELFFTNTLAGLRYNFYCILYNNLLMFTFYANRM